MKNIIPIIAGLLIFWLVISNIVFAFRHPWATDIERLLYTKSALLFKKVPYSEMRPRE